VRGHARGREHVLPGESGRKEGRQRAGRAMVVVRQQTGTRTAEKWNVASG